MQRSDLEKKNLPDKPGVYFFKKGRNVLYIGKATSIRDRVRSYFSSDIETSRGAHIKKMISEASSVTCQETDSVLEAIILEARFIKQYWPPYNTREKDNKSFNYVVITDEPWPRVIIVRGRELAKIQFDRKNQTTLNLNKNKSRSRSTSAILRKTPIKKVFGPFTQGGSLRESLKLIRKIFPFRDQKCIPASEQKNPDNPKPCFNHQIGLCPGVCTGQIKMAEYKKHINNIKLFFEGKKKSLIKKLKKEMSNQAKSDEFEKAAKTRDMIHALNHINDTALLTRGFFKDINDSEGVFRIEAYDVAHMSGQAIVGVMTVFENGEADKNEYRKFNLKTVVGVNDTGALKEIIHRRMKNTQWMYPKLIVVDGGKAQKNAAEKVLNDAGIYIPVVAVRKDERHKPRDILGLERAKVYFKDKVKEENILKANAEAHRFAIATHRKKMRNR